MNIGRTADFTIRAILLFTTLVTLMFFTNIYNPIVFWVLTWVLIIAVIVKGVADLVEKK